MPKYSMTVPVDSRLHTMFAQACKVESLTLSKGFEIAIECIVAKEIVENRDVRADGKPVCFNLDQATVTVFKDWAKTCLCQAHAANTVLATALNNGFGGPLAIKAA